MCCCPLYPRSVTLKSWSPLRRRGTPGAWWRILCVRADFVPHLLSLREASRRTWPDTETSSPCPLLEDRHPLRFVLACVVTGLGYKCERKKTILSFLDRNESSSKIIDLYDRFLSLWQMFVCSFLFFKMGKYFLHCPEGVIKKKTKNGSCVI